MNMPTLSEMLKSGVHFGHHKSKRHPNMEPYIYASKDDISVIDLEQTAEKLADACTAVKDLAASGKTILFIGTKRQAAEIVKKAAIECEQPYVTERWLGGMLTNYQSVAKGARKLTKLKKQKEAGDLDKYTKREQLEIDREIDRLETLYGGTESMTKLPDAVFIVDLKEEHTALREAKQMKIPVIAMCDSNVNPWDCEHAIPSNDDAIKSVEMIVGLVSAAAKDGKANPVAPKEAPKKEEKNAEAKKEDKK